MRTTLTLDDDVAAKLKAEQSRAGLPFKEVVNETLGGDWKLAHRRAQAVAAVQRGLIFCHSRRARSDGSGYPKPRRTRSTGPGIPGRTCGPPGMTTH